MKTFSNLTKFYDETINKNNKKQNICNRATMKHYQKEYFENTIVMIIFLDFIILTQILFSFQKIGLDVLRAHLVDCNRHCNVTVISMV